MSKALNARERFLALLVCGLLVGGGLVFSGVRAKGYLGSLNSTIAQREQELINLTQQNAQRSAIEVAYRAVVSERSSQMTQEEIHDNLRREIFRLAKVSVRGKDGGAPRVIELVRIPTLREGELVEVGDGVREYQIQFRVPTARLQNLLRFIKQIETSKQILRIDALDIMRAPDGIEVQSSFVITRIVLDAPENDRRARGSERVSPLRDDRGGV